MKINLVKFQPSRSEGVGGDRGDGGTRDVTPFSMSPNDFSTRTTLKNGRKLQISINILHSK